MRLYCEPYQHTTVLCLNSARILYEESEFVKAINSLKRSASQHAPTGILNKLPRYMIAVSKTQVPQYLRSGAFYQALGDDGGAENELIDVPADALKPEATVTTAEDLRHILTSLRFWGVDPLLPEVATFILDHNSSKCVAVCREFTTAFPYIPILRAVANADSSQNKLNEAVNSGNLEVVDFLWSTHRLKDCIHLTCRAAARAGHVHLLQYFHQKKGNPLRQDIVQEAAATGGHLRCLEYIT